MFIKYVHSHVHGDVHNMHLWMFIMDVLSNVHRNVLMHSLSNSHALTSDSFIYTKLLSRLPGAMPI